MALGAEIDELEETTGVGVTMHGCRTRFHLGRNHRHRHTPCQGLTRMPALE